MGFLVKTKSFFKTNQEKLTTRTVGDQNKFTARTVGDQNKFATKAATLTKELDDDALGYVIGGADGSPNEVKTLNIGDLVYCNSLKNKCYEIPVVIASDQTGSVVCKIYNINGSTMSYEKDESIAIGQIFNCLNQYGAVVNDK